jgi:hypothetical protein
MGYTPVESLADPSVQPNGRTPDSLGDESAELTHEVHLSSIDNV